MGCDLRLQPVGWKYLADLCVGVGAQAIHESSEVLVPGGAPRTVGEMVRGRRIDRLAAALDEITVEEPLFRQVTPATDHGLPPSSPRSFRAARNRCTRTVDSFRPVIAAISRGVKSP